MRAVTQNRRMAAAMGIRTGMVDAMTFGLGSGIARVSLAWRCRRSTTSCPNLGQSYIIDSFLVVIFGGVGNLVGHARRGTVARRRQQAARALRRRGARQDRAARARHSVHPEAPARPLCTQGRAIEA